MTTTDLDLGRYKLGWSDAEDYVFKPKKGLSEEIVREMSAHEGRARVDARLPPQGAQALLRQAHGAVVRREHAGPRLRQHLLLREADRGSGEGLGRPARVDQDDLREARHPRGRAQVPGRGDGPVRVPPRVDARVDDAGMRPIKELAPGDEVFSLDEATKQIDVGRVVGHGWSGEKEIFEITARGRTIGASANHPFLVLRDERRPGAKKARTGRRGSRSRTSRSATWSPSPPTSRNSARLAPLLVPDRPEAARYPTTTTDDLCWWAGSTWATAT